MTISLLQRKTGMTPQTHKNTHSIFVQKEAEFKQRKGVIILVPMLVTGCKNQRSKQSREPQLHKAKLVQRNLNTGVLTFSAGSLHRTCVEMQNLFTGVALKEKREFLTGFWVTDCYLIYCFRPNKSNKQGTIKGML